MSIAKRCFAAGAVVAALLMVSGCNDDDAPAPSTPVNTPSAPAPAPIPDQGAADPASAPSYKSSTPDAGTNCCIPMNFGSGINIYVPF